MKTSKIQIVDSYDNKKIITEHIDMYLTYMDDPHTKKKEVWISNKVQVISDFSVGVELIGIFAHFIQFSAFIPEFTARKQIFKRVLINCFY